MRSLLTSLLIVSLLAGCQAVQSQTPCDNCNKPSLGRFSPGWQPSKSAQQVSTAERPLVVVDKGIIVVQTEPLVFSREERHIEIIWRLPEDSNYSFPEDGIVFDDGHEIVEGGKAGKQRLGSSKAEFNCGLVKGNDKLFRCVNKHGIPERIRYKYTIRVLNGDKLLEPQDPTAMNN